MSKLTRHSFVTNSHGEFTIFEDPRGGWVKYDDMIEAGTFYFKKINVINVFHPIHSKQETHEWKVSINDTKLIRANEKGFVEITAGNGTVFETEMTMEEFESCEVFKEPCAVLLSMLGEKR